VVADTRKRLAGASLPERVYARLRQEAERADVPPFRLSDAAGPTAAQVFVRASKQPLSEGVPGMFTVPRYGKAVSPAADAIARRMFAEEPAGLRSKTPRPVA